MLGIDLPKDSHFLFLESVNTEEILKKTRVKVVHIVNFLNEKELSIGRGHDCKVRITDISISRLHGIFKVINDNEIWIEDKSSKFGILQLQQSPIMLTPQMGKLSLQRGRTLVEYQMVIP